MGESMGQYRRHNKVVEEMTSELCYAFCRIQNPSRFNSRPYLTRKEIIRAYERFIKHRGRSEWEHEAVTKAILGCECPVWMIWSSGFPEENKKAGERITCDKCERSFRPNKTID